MKQFITLILLSLALLVPSFAAEESAFSGRSKSLSFPLKRLLQKFIRIKYFLSNLKAIVANDKIDALSNTFSGASGVEVLNPQNPWERSRDNTYYNTFYFKINSKSVVMPRLSVSLIDRQALESEVIALNTPFHS